MSDIIKKYDIGFTQVPNKVLADSTLSLKAKGLYAYLFSKPDGWQFHISVMSKEISETEYQVRMIIKELVDKGYITRQQYNENGKFGGMIYTFVDPENRITEQPYTKKPVYGKTITHNNIDIINNTENINNTDKVNTPPVKIPVAGKPKEQKLSFGEFGKVKLTKEEFIKLVDKYGWYTEAAIDILDGYLASKGDKYKSHYPVFRHSGWVWDEAFKRRENGLPPIHNTIIDPSSPTGARAETALEYYTRKYGLGKQQGKEKNDVGEKENMHIPD